jgi:rare lipoprotein A (peptidoglycan hydrolase)
MGIYGILQRQAKDMNRSQTSTRARPFGFNVLLLAVSAIQGCSMISGAPDPSIPTGSDSIAVGSRETRAHVVNPNVHVGVASWYGPGFNGKKTASGEIFDETKFTAAHKTLPLGSRARVVHLENGKSVEVTINDRGPYIEGRIIDLSRAAAKALGMIDMGVTEVRIELLAEAVAAANARNVNRQ